MFDKLIQILTRLRGRGKPLEPLNKQLISEPPHSGKAVILCGAECDELTGILKEWLKDIPVPPEINKHLLVGNSVERGEVTQLLEVVKENQSVKIFVGHGAPNALLGPPLDEATIIQIDGKEFAVLYDADSARLGPDTLFAFCCYSALDLGEKFIALGDRTFLGYTAKLPLDLDNEQCQKVWKSLFHTISLEIIKDGAIAARHEGLLIDLYNEVYDFFRHGEGKNNDRTITNLMYIVRHKKLLRRLGGSN